MTLLRVWLGRPRPGTSVALGRELLRLAVARTARRPADALGAPVRSCLVCGDPTHGPPRWPDSGVWASVSRSGSVVAVAAVRPPRPAGPGLRRPPEHGLGLDVVRGATRLVPRSADLLSAAELAGPAPADPDLVRLWARKEAVLKALGVGLAVPVADVTVGPSGAPGWWTASVAGTGSWRGPGAARRQHRPPVLGTDVDGGPGGAGLVLAVALVVDRPVPVVLRDAGQLLGRG